jgi:Domain of unknown function (DUF4439)
MARAASGDSGGGPASAALQSALSAENAAVYGYGLAGARLTGGQFAVAQGYWNGHRAARATLITMITGLGAAPVPAAAAYRPPFPVNSAGAAASLAAMLEDGVLTAYLGLVAVDDPSLRAFGAQRMQSAAIRAAYWRGSTVPFPGLPPSALRG